MNGFAGSREEIQVLTAAYSTHQKPFILDQKEGLTFYLFRLQTEGTCYAWMHNGYVRVDPGDLLLYQPGDAYELRVGFADAVALSPKDTFRSTDYYVMARGLWLDQWWKESIKRAKKIQVNPDDELLPIWRQLIQEKRRIRDGNKQIEDYLLRILCLSLNRVPPGRTASMGRPSYVAYRIKQFIEQHAAGPLTLQQIASEAGLSPSRASHLFKEAFGQSIMDYAIEVRLSMACEHILFGAMTLEKVAEISGFHSYSYFHRTFRARMGLSPREFREQQQHV